MIKQTVQSQLKLAIFNNVTFVPETTKLGNWKNFLGRNPRNFQSFWRFGSHEKFLDPPFRWL